MPEKKAKKKVAKKISSTKVSKNYGAQSIQVLEGLDPVRKRPGMYIGGTGLTGLHHMIWEVVDNAIDEAMAGHATACHVRVLPGNVIEVSDNGRGIPVDKHPTTKKSTLETVLTILHAGGKFGGDESGYKVSGGLHGVGVSVVNALSEWTRAEVKRDGKVYVQEYKRGKPKGAVKAVGKCKKDDTGTTITFKADHEIFEDTTFNFETIVKHLRNQAYLTKAFTIKIEDYRQTGLEPGKDDLTDITAITSKDLCKVLRHGFYFDAGIVSFVKFLNRGREIKNNVPFYIEKTIDDVAVEVSLQYTDQFTERLHAFANNVANPEGGTHVAGFRTALTRTINSYARKNNLLKEKDANLTADDMREGLTCVINVKITDPQFEGQTKGKLNNVEVRGAVQAAINEEFTEYLEQHPKDAKAIIEKCLLTARARTAARAAKDAVLRKGALEGMTLPGKLSDCTSRRAEDSELYIVEGDSAGGSAKQGRDRMFQAILPLRGKLVNVEKTTLDKIVKSDSLKPMIIAFGVGIGEALNIEKLRYHKIILMADADVDGSHIRTLLLTFLFRQFRQLIEDGYVYIAQPPLYQIKKGKQIEYAYIEEDKARILKEMGVTDEEVSEEVEGEVPEEADGEAATTKVEEKAKAKKVNIQRYKGLGEMNPEQLWETTMDPQTRKMMQVTIEDAEAADNVFELLMGAEVAPRKHFIQTHAKTVENIDV